MKWFLLMSILISGLVSAGEVETECAYINENMKSAKTEVKAVRVNSSTSAVKK